MNSKKELLSATSIYFKTLFASISNFLFVSFTFSNFLENICTSYNENFDYFINLLVYIYYLYMDWDRVWFGFVFVYELYKIRFYPDP